jgi:hypothetical protein
MLELNHNHTFILLDESLKILAVQRRWKEYNTTCCIRSNNMTLQKVNLDKFRTKLKFNQIEGLRNTCAICLYNCNNNNNNNKKK